MCKCSRTSATVFIFAIQNCPVVFLLNAVRLWCIFCIEISLETNFKESPSACVKCHIKSNTDAFFLWPNRLVRTQGSVDSVPFCCFLYFGLRYIRPWLKPRQWRIFKSKEQIPWVHFNHSKINLKVPVTRDTILSVKSSNCPRRA